MCLICSGLPALPIFTGDVIFFQFLLVKWALNLYLNFQNFSTTMVMPLHWDRLPCGLLWLCQLYCYRGLPGSLSLVIILPVWSDIFHFGWMETLMLCWRRVLLSNSDCGAPVLLALVMMHDCLLSSCFKGRLGLHYNFSLMLMAYSSPFCISRRIHHA